MGYVTLVLTAAKAYSDWDTARKAGRNAKKESARLAEIRKRLRDLPPLELEKIKANYPELKNNLIDLVSSLPIAELSSTKMSEIATDPRLADAQYSTLDTLDEVSKEGMTREDAYALEEIRQRSARDTSSQQQAALQALAQRGLGGSGAEMSARLLAAQGGANRGAQQAMDLAQQKRAAALQAVMQRGGIASGMRDQQFGEQSDIARAEDTIAKFNAEARNTARGLTANAMSQQVIREDQQTRDKMQHEINITRMNNDAKEAERRAASGDITGGPSSYAEDQAAITAGGQQTGAILTGVGTIDKTAEQQGWFKPKPTTTPEPKSSPLTYTPTGIDPATGIPYRNV